MSALIVGVALPYKCNIGNCGLLLDCLLVLERGGMATAAHTALRAAILEWEKNLKGDTLPAYVNLKDNRTVVRSRVTKFVNSLKLIIDGDDAFVIRESQRPEMTLLTEIIKFNFLWSQILLL